MTSLLMVGCSMFLLRLTGMLGHQLYGAMLMVQLVLRSSSSSISTGSGCSNSSDSNSSFQATSDRQIT